MGIEDLPYDTDSMRKLKKDVINLLQEQGPLHNYKIAEELDPAKYGWSESTLLQALGHLRNYLKDDMITVKTKRGDSSRKKKVWVLDDNRAAAAD